MPLTLTVTSYKGNPPPKPNSISIERESISIGRNEANSLVLSDPESIVSGKHAEIEYRDDGYYIIDSSTNHTLIDQLDKQSSESHILKGGQSARLNDNDLLTIGDYEVRVSITSQPAQAAVDSPSYRDGYENPESLFGNDELPGSGSGDPFADIATGSEGNEDLLNPAAQSRNTDDDFSFLDDIIESDQGSAGQNLTDPDADDPFADLGSAQGDADNISQANAQAHENAQANETADEFSFLDSIGKSGQPVADNIPGQDTDDPFAEIDPLVEDKRKPPKKPGKATTAPRKPRPQPPPDSDAEVDPDHIMNFLQGAGIANSSIASNINANTFYLIGQLLSRSLQGAIQVLWARSKIKSELGMEVTVIHGHRNNPLKFSPSAQESLVKMLDPQGEAYMPALEAIDEAFSDIGAHEMAVMAGMRSALGDVLKRFDPEHLEQRLQKKSPTSLKIPGYKQAMLWDLYKDLYEEIEKEAQDNFNRLFGRAFTKAYNEQLRKPKDNR